MLSDSFHDNVRGVRRLYRGDGRPGRRTILGALIAMAAPGLGGTAGAQRLTRDAKSSLVPTGSLRVAINLGNTVLARRDAAGNLGGVSVDIARELGRRLDVPVHLIPFDAAGQVSAAASGDIWDVAFLARDPERARSITFTEPYVVIDGSYVVPRDSGITALDGVDRNGVRVAVVTGSAYDLFLTRALKHAQLVRAPSTPEAIALFRAERLDVIAGVKQALNKLVADDLAVRMIPQGFMTIHQAMGAPAGRPADTAAYLAAFVEDIKASGFVAQALERNGQGDATIAPPG